MSSRSLHTATLLSSGKVLIAGGLVCESGINILDGPGHSANDASLFDPGTGLLTPILIVDGNQIAHPPMVNTHAWHASALLSNGSVLVAGGSAGHSLAEVYNPTTGLFSAVSNMHLGRMAHTATALNTGLVLIAGGYTVQGCATHSSAELFNPSAGTFALIGTMVHPRWRHSATLLQSGKVLIVGGTNGVMASATAELYDPAAGTFAATGNPGSCRVFHTATLLPSGKVLIAGGIGTGSAGEVKGCVLFDPAAGTFSATGDLIAGRYGHTATLLSNGKVLIVGGNAPTSEVGSPRLNSCEIYDPTTGLFSATASLAHARSFHTATLVSTGKVMVVGGVDIGTETDNFELL